MRKRNNESTNSLIISAWVSVNTGMGVLHLLEENSCLIVKSEIDLARLKTEANKAYVLLGKQIGKPWLTKKVVEAFRCVENANSLLSSMIAYGSLSEDFEVSKNWTPKGGLKLVVQKLEEARKTLKEITC